MVAGRNASKVPGERVCRFATGDDTKSVRTTTPMSTPPDPLSVTEISQRIRQAAVAKSWRPGHHLSSGPASLPETGSFHTSRIQAALQRARRKTFSKQIKPLRRLSRNQGAVNDSLIEAVHHLALQNEEMREELSDLRDLVHSLHIPPRASSGAEMGDAKDVLG